MVNRTSSSESTTWLVIALVAALLAAGAGWALARTGSPSWDELARSEAVVREQAAQRGYQRGVRQGARQGGREAGLRSRYEVLAARRGAYDSGYSAGRDRAQLESDLGSAGAGLGAGLSLDGGYPESVDDLLASSSLGADDGLGASSYADAYAAADAWAPGSMRGYGDWYRGSSSWQLDR